MKKTRQHWTTISPVPEVHHSVEMEPEQAEMFGYEPDLEFPGRYFPVVKKVPAPAWMDRWNEKRRESDNDPASPEQAWA